MVFLSFDLSFFYGLPVRSGNGVAAGKYKGRVPSEEGILFSVFSFSFSSSFFLFFLSLFFLLLKGAAETEGYIKAAEIKAIGEMGMAESWSRKGNF